MRVNVNMPQLGESVAEGTIIKWLKQVGDKVEKDEDILEISTDKVDSEIPSPAAGILVEILVQEGETVEVGKPIALIETDVSQVKVIAETPKVPAVEKTEDEAPTASVVAYGTSSGEEAISLKRKPEKEKPAETKGKKFYSPLVRKIAEEEAISQTELDNIEGTGAGGRVTKKDLEGYIAARGTAPAPAKVAPTGAIPPPILKVSPAVTPSIGEGEEIVPMDIMRQKIAEHMVKSAFTAPHVTSVSEADMSNIVTFRERNKREFERREGFKLTYTPIIIEATIKALKEYPWLNASLDGNNIVVKHYVNMGVAVALENGLIVPVIKGADGMNLLALARAVHDLSERARTKRLNPDEVHGSTFSITNPGIFGNLFGSPIINQPNLAILGIGAIVKRPVVVGEDAITVRPMMYLSLSYDHRIIDGALAGQFLERLVHHMENYNREAII